MIPDNTCILRLTAAAGTELADAYSSGTRQTFLPEKRGLQPLGLHPSRGIAPSGLSPIAENSPLLPPVGVWTVSQFQCV